MGNKRSSRMVRISITLDECLEDLSKTLSVKLGRPVTKTEASRILAAQDQYIRTQVLVAKKKGKRIGLGSEIMWL